MKNRIINGAPLEQAYTDQWLLDNQNNIVNGSLVSEWELAPLYTGNFVKPIWDGGKYVESATTGDQLAHSEEVEYKKYHKRIIDGIDAVARYSAEIRALKLAGVIDEQSHKAVDAELEPIRNKLIAGQWVDAKDYLVSVGTTIIGQSTYDKIFAGLDSYINENY